MKSDSKRVIATTILGITRNGKAALGGDGQVTFNDTIVKHGSTKIRRLHNDTVLTGFAGAAADALTLFERFEEKLESHKGNLRKAVVELAKDWRTDRYLRRLEALLICIDTEHSFVVSGTGDIIEPDDGIVSIGAGGAYALSASRAYMDVDPEMPLRDVVEKSLLIASRICPYTNDQISLMTLPDEESK